jgi:hypothetical protein
MEMQVAFVNANNMVGPVAMQMVIAPSVPTLLHAATSPLGSSFIAFVSFGFSAVTSIDFFLVTNTTTPLVSFPFVNQLSNSFPFLLPASLLKPFTPYQAVVIND